MKRSVYSILGGQEKLVSEEEFDANGNCILRKDFTMHPLSENIMEYDVQNNLLVDRELSGGVEMNRTEYEINSNNEIIRSAMYFGDSIYEEITWDRTDSGYTKLVKQDGILIEKLVIDNVARTTSHHYFQDEQLVQTTEITHDPATKVDKTIVKNVEKGTEFSSIRSFSETGDVTSYEEFNAEGKLLRSSSITYDGILIESETHKELERGSRETTISYFYDENSNLVKSEVRNPAGNLLSFYTWKYNDKGQVIEEAGTKEDLHEGGYGSAALGNKFHRRIDYLES